MSTNLSPALTVSPDQLQALSRELIAVGELLESSGNAAWFPVARAAAVIDGLRHNILTIPAQGEEATHGPH